jgi:hypothetical protein
VRRTLTAFALAATLCLFVSPAAFADPPTADEQLYSTAVATMRALPEPAYVTFVANVTGEGLNTIDVVNDHGSALIRLGIGNSIAEPSAAWPTSYRTRDDLASIVDKPQSRLLTHSPLFSPTWTGAYDWMRYGLNGRPDVPDPSPQPSTSPDPNLKVIGIVSVIGSAFYRITAANPMRCPSGSPGRHLHLEPRNNPAIHPLTDVTIDLASTRFCSMRFRLAVTGTGSLTRVNGFEELHFSAASGYWVTTNGDADIAIGPRQLELHLKLEDMHFPDTLDDALFAR